MIPSNATSGKIHSENLPFINELAAKFLGFSYNLFCCVKNLFEPTKINCSIEIVRQPSHKDGYGK